MKCWNCDEPMERQDGYAVCTENYRVPNATYRCEDCGFSIVMEFGKHKRIVVLHDPREEANVLVQ